MYAMRRELNQYQQNGYLAEAAVANPHRQIQILFEAILERIAVARGAMNQGNVRLKGEKLSHAINIINGLRGMLDHDRGGEISANLDTLYEYMARRLLEGNLHNDPKALEEVSQLIRKIKSGWDAIPEQMRQAS